MADLIAAWRTLWGGCASSGLARGQATAKSMFFVKFSIFFDDFGLICKQPPWKELEAVIWTDLEAVIKSAEELQEGAWTSLACKSQGGCSSSRLDHSSQIFSYDIVNGS